MANLKPAIFTREFILTSFISFLVSINFYTLLATIPSFVLDVLKLGEAEAGLAGGLFVFGMVFSRLVAGKLVVKLGFKRMLLIGICGLTATSVGYFFVPSISVLFIIRFLNGFSFGMTSNTNITLITAIIPRNRSGEGVGYYSMFQMLAWALGPTIGMSLQRGGDYTSVFMLTTVLPAIGLVFIPFLRTRDISLDAETGQPAQGAKKKNGNLLDAVLERKIFPIAGLCLVAMLFMSSILGFLPVYSQQIHLERSASVYFVIFVGAILATRPLVSKLFDRKGPDIVLYPAILASGLAYFVLANAQIDFMIVLTGLLIGFGFGAVMNTTLALSVTIAPRHRLSIANATYYMSIDLAAALGPTIAGVIIPVAGYSGMFTFAGVYTLLALPLYFFAVGRYYKKLRSKTVG